MKKAEIESRIRGCILGAALGDAFGAPFEFKPFQYVADAVGGSWIDGLYPFKWKGSPHGVWAEAAPPGTGTDDTRYNWLFLELAAELGRMPSAQEIAGRYLEVYRAPEVFFGAHSGSAAKQFEAWEGVCRGCLGEPSALYPGIPPEILRQRSVGLNFPTLIGLISLTSAGLLFPGQPEQAYRAAYQADFADVGYARECVALLAAAISAALAADDSPEATFGRTLALDPFALGGPFGGPLVKERLTPFLGAIPKDLSPKKRSEHLSRALSHLHPFDPFKTLAIAFAAVLAAPGAPLDAISIAANQRGVEPDGALGRFEDIDCYGCIAGAIAGAAAGEDAFPAGMLEQVVASNRALYGFDLRATANRFIESLR